MPKVSSGVRAGAAAFVVGLFSLACPQCLAVAAANDAEGDTAGVSAGAQASPASSRGSKVGPRAANARPGRAAPPSGGDGQSAGRVADRVAAVSDGPGDGPPVRPARTAAPAGVTPLAAASTRPRQRPASTVQPTAVDSVGALRGSPGIATSVSGPVPLAAEVVVAPATASIPVVADNVATAVPKRLARGANVRAVAPRAFLDSPAVAVGKFLDSVADWVSGLPANPITEFLDGVLLLVRRTFFNVGSDGSKPGLISSDWLTVDKTTGEVFGDEPVMVTVMLTTTLGQEGSTRIRLIDSHPNEIDDGVDAGDRVRIPDVDGDAWINYSGGQVTSVNVTSGGSGYDSLYQPSVRIEGGGGKGAAADAVVPEAENPDGSWVDSVRLAVLTNPGSGYTFAPKVIIDPPGNGEAAVAVAAIGSDTLQPLTLKSVFDAQSQGVAVPIPIVAIVTLMLEGDNSTSGDIAGMGRLVGEALNEVAVELEKTKIVIGDPPDAAAMKEVIETTLAAIQDRFTIDVWKGHAGWLGYLVDAALQRIGLWFRAVGDPDDPIGLSATVQIPVDADFLVGLDSLGYDPRSFCEEAAKCSVDYIRVTSGGRYTTLPEVVLEGGQLPGTAGATAKVVSGRGIIDATGTEYFYVKGVEVTNSGDGYSTAPTVVFQGGQPLSDDEVAAARTFLKGAPGHPEVGALLEENYIGLKVKRVENPLWDTNIELRYGFLVPPEALHDGNPQSWTTLYAGDYVDNDWAEYRVETQAWPRVSW